MDTYSQSDARLFSDIYMQDPHAVYAELRGAGPVHKAKTPTGLPVWVVTGYDEVRSGLADPRLGKDAARLRTIIEQASMASSEVLTAPESVAADMLNSDPPEHTRLRRLVSKGFTARRIERLRPRVARVTDELLDAIAGREAAGPVDIVGSLAFPLPVIVICELLGIPHADRDTFRDWSQAVIGAGPPDRVRRVSTAMGGYLAQVMTAKRSAPADDLLSDLIELSDSGDQLTPLELVSMAGLLLIAGHETTVNLVAGGLLALLRHPDQLAKLRARPELLDGAIEEFLRYDPPAAVATMRFATEYLVLGGVTIPAGDIVLLALSAANRDGERFADPDSLDIERPAAGHLSFGHGIHFCLGASLARMEAKIALGKLIERFPAIKLAVDPGDLRWRPSVVMHGLVDLPVWLE